VISGTTITWPTVRRGRFKYMRNIEQAETFEL